MTELCRGSGQRSLGCDSQPPLHHIRRSWLGSMDRRIKLDEETGKGSWLRKPYSEVTAEEELCHSHVCLLPPSARQVSLHFCKISLLLKYMTFWRAFLFQMSLCEGVSVGCNWSKHSPVPLYKNPRATLALKRRWREAEKLLSISVLIIFLQFQGKGKTQQ